jgi:hypothetical protein
MMTVYFIRAIGDADRIKIGVADNLNKRLSCIATEIDGGIELLAQCPGDIQTEALLHLLFDEDRIDGEWFKPSASINRAIAALGHLAGARRFWGRLKAIESMPLSPLDEDRQIARAALDDVIATLPAMTIGRAISEVYRLLNERNPAWTRRRVRGIYAKEVARVDLFELRDLRSLLGPELTAEALEFSDKARDQG